MGWNLLNTAAGLAGAVGGAGFGGFLGSSAGKLLTGGLGAIFGSGGSSYDQDKQNQFNREERIAAQEYNTREREESQRYQTNTMREMNAFNSQQRVSQNQWSEDMYNKYESPEAKVAQYDAAGLNPRMAANGQFGQVQSSSSPQASAPSAPSGTHVSPPYQDIASSSLGFVNMAKALESMASAQKQGVDTTRMQKFMDEELKGIQISNLNRELMFRVNEKYLDKQAEAALKYVLSQTDVNNETIGKIRQEIDLLKKKGVLLDKDADWYEQKLLAQMGEQFANRKLAETREENERRYGGQVMLSEANRNNSAAALDRAQKKLLDYEDDINQAVKEHRIQDIKNKVNVYARNANIQLQIAAAQAKKALVEGKYPEFEYWWNKGMDLVDRSIDIYQSVKGFNVDMSQHNDRLNEQRREFDDMMVFRWTGRADYNVRHPAPPRSPEWSY